MIDLKGLLSRSKFIQHRERGGKPTEGTETATTEQKAAEEPAAMRQAEPPVISPNQEAVEA